MREIFCFPVVNLFILYEILLGVFVFVSFCPVCIYELDSDTYQWDHHSADRSGAPTMCCVLCMD